MKMIISPAKQMVSDDEPLVSPTPIRFPDQVTELMADLKSRTPAELQELWRCSDKLARENVARVQAFDLKRVGTPAVFAYAGIQYQSLGAGVLTDRVCKTLGNAYTSCPGCTGS